jgi:hypothetical protein
MRSSIALVALSSMTQTAFLAAQDVADTIAVAEPLPYVRIVSDSKGSSHFEDAYIDLSLADYAPPAPPISVSDAIPADGVVFLSSPIGWFGGLHPAPHRQLIVLLSGERGTSV